MKEKIHPRFYDDARVVCACGNTFTTGSTRKELRVEICGKCHPFYTGEKRMMDAAGRVERFRKRYAASAEAIAMRKERQAARIEKEKAAAAETAPEVKPPAKKEKKARAAAPATAADAAG